MSIYACYGLIAVFDGDSDTCRDCSEVATCQQAVYSKLVDFDIETSPTIKPLLKRHERWARKLGNKTTTATSFKERFTTPKNDKRVVGLNKTALEMARALVHNCLDPTNCTLQDAQVLPKHLSLLTHEVTSSKQFTTRGLINALIEKLEWSEHTAKSYASGFVELLNHWGKVKRVKRGEYRVL